MRKLIAPILLFLLLIIIFHPWFNTGLLSSFDFPYYSKLMIDNNSFNIFAWDWHVGLDGLAGFVSPYSWIFPVVNFPQVLLGKLGLEWPLIQRIAYLYPLLIFLVLSPIIFIRYLISKNNFYLLAILIFSFNTYSLLLYGGQIFLALAYSLIPIVFILFARLLEYSDFNKVRLALLITGLVFSFQMLVETRFAFITLFIVVSYFLFRLLFQERPYRQSIYKLCYSLAVPLTITFLLHSFWIIPTFFYGKNPIEQLGVAYSSGEAVRFLSFATLENSISLLHSNWPENIFGKVYFMRFEFLLLPIMAFSSLFFLRKEKKEYRVNILFFALLGLIGVFFAKGSNPPFGEVYIWLFNYFPGFGLFRDPAKWYPLIALSYSILIPFTVFKIYELLKTKKYYSKIFLTLVVVYLLFLIRPAIFGQLGGVFKSTIVPQDYTKLEKFIYEQPSYFRTVWVPSRQRFGYYSQLHPQVSARVLFNVYDSDKLLNTLNKSESLLQKISAKYVIIPNDSEGEIFLEDRKYSEKNYLGTVDKVSKISWLKPVGDFGKIKVYEISSFKNHFWITEEGSVQYKYISPVEYQVELENVKKGEILVLSEKFDSKWQAMNGQFKIESSKYDIFNSFVLPKDGSYSLKIYYQPQDWVNIGIIISSLSFISVLGLIIWLRK